MNQQDREVLQAVYDKQWASTREVERSTRFGFESVTRRLKKLRDGGYVECRGGTGRHGSFEYRIPINVLPAVISDKLT